MFKYLIRSNPLLLVREAFASLLPIVLVMNVLVLLSSLPKLLESLGMTGVSALSGNEVYQLYFFLIPLFLNLSFSTLLSKDKELDQIGTLLISMVCFFRISGYLSINSIGQIFTNQTSILSVIPVTFLVISLLHYLSRFSIFRFISRHTVVSPRLTKTLNLLIPGLLTLLSVEIVRQLLQGLNNLDLPSFFSYSFPFFAKLSQIKELVLFKVIAQFSWFLGIHGEYSAEGFFLLVKQIPKGEFTGIHLKTFHDVFMNIGGSGSTFVIPIIILFSKQAKPFQSIARLSLPFSFFNVNEILLFGLPIILNPIFFVPFFMAPLLNMAIALLAIHLKLFEIDPASIHWMSPPLYSAYIATHGSIWAVITQMLCILVDGLIYLPFLLIARQQFRIPLYLSNLLGEDAFAFVNEEINIHEERLFLTKQSISINSMTSARKMLGQLRGGHFLIYFQPKVDTRSKKLVGLEALLRFQNIAGEILPPTFFPVLYEQGLSKAMDKKVVNLVFEQVLRWRDQGLNVPPISVNFDKDFLLDKQAVQAFLDRSKEHNIQFYIEITEHTFTVEVESLASVVDQLRLAGHWISIDDFGAGYSSLTSLLTLKADEIKLDRSLVVAPQGEEKRGQVLLAASVKLCKDLGFKVVAEGVESLPQLHLVQACGVDTVQGYLTGHPMNSDQVSLLFAQKS